MYENGYYAIAGGELKYAASENASLGSFRWYMNIESRTQSSVPQASIAIREIDGTTGVEEVRTEDANVKGIYDLQGRKIDEITKPGLYIVDGKKVLVK